MAVQVLAPATVTLHLSPQRPRLAGLPIRPVTVPLKLSLAASPNPAYYITKGARPFAPGSKMIRQQVVGVFQNDQLVGFSLIFQVKLPPDPTGQIKDQLVASNFSVQLPASQSQAGMVAALVDGASLVIKGLLGLT